MKINQTKQFFLLLLALMLIMGSILYLESVKSKEVRTVTAGDNGKNLPEILRPSGFVNANPFMLKDYIGKKVILVDFWTYSCINCVRTIPYLNQWQEKYADKGLLIVGVHTPEFEFEKKIENVSAEAQKFGITYPVVLDNDYATWNAFGNSYWPHEYLIGIDGTMLYDHVGEGNYEETERHIQKALGAAGNKLGNQNNIEKPKGAFDVEFAKVASPETYFGAKRNENFGSGNPFAPGMVNSAFPKTTAPNKLYLSGTWNIADEFAENFDSNAKILFQYNAKSVYLVASGREKISVTVFRDGKPVKETAGADVLRDGSGKAEIYGERLYRLIEGESYGVHTIEIIIESPGLKAFAFTFG